MSDVELVALWLGLGAGLVSIVLAIVAMAFTFAVDKRSSRINEEMIKSLQKIHSSVDGTASDTKDLIKVAWERMLAGSVQQPDVAAVDAENESVQAIAAGVAAELRAELGGANTASEEEMKRLNEAFQRMERTMQAQLSSAPSAGLSSRSRFSKLQADIDQLTPGALALLAQLAQHGHLERDQYSRLRKTPLGMPLTELRAKGMLTPLSGTSADGSHFPVYWFAPSMSELVKPALNLADPPPRTALDRAKALLLEVGYPKDADPPETSPVCEDGTA